MAKKHNKTAREIDLTSFEFVQKCGGCHPGGGAAEIDRDGQRYDTFAARSGGKIVSGGDNGFDGDYYKARWAESGVLEADCLLCHLPGYDQKLRKAQIARQNFRWAATAGSHLATVSGAVKDGATPAVIYDTSRFAPDGKLALHLVRQVPPENCLNCHTEPDWKKKGASYSPRTDVHLRAGLKCVDCHVAGRHATDPRIRGREMHQIGKGDDPTGLVRDDLDNTMRTCESCHLRGELRTKVALHPGLPPRHLDKIACLTCHVPQRQVKGALMQDSTVFNPAPRISVAGKRIWTFYGPNLRPWNLYGEASTLTAKRQPLQLHTPVHAWYKGKIYPLNRINAIWYAYVTPAGRVTGQPYMKDLYRMWTQHRGAPKKRWPGLSLVKDDNHDGAPELDRPQEIKAALAAVTSFVQGQGERLGQAKVALVSDTRYTVDGRSWRPLAVKPEAWQYTAYSSVFKLSHDIAPATAALGARGCTECHSDGAPFWRRPVLARAFDQPGAASSWVPNAELLGLSPLAEALGGFRHQRLEPIMALGALAAAALLVLLLAAGLLRVRRGDAASPLGDRTVRLLVAVLGVGLLGPGVLVACREHLALATIGLLGTLHLVIAVLFVVTVVISTALSRPTPNKALLLLAAGLVWMTTTGLVLFFSDSMNARQIALTLHDVGAGLLGTLAAGVLLGRMISLRWRRSAAGDDGA